MTGYRRARTTERALREAATPFVLPRYLQKGQLLDQGLAHCKVERGDPSTERGHVDRIAKAWYQGWSQWWFIALTDDALGKDASCQRVADHMEISVTAISKQRTGLIGIAPWRLLALGRRGGSEVFTAPRDHDQDLLGFRRGISVLRLGNVCACDYISSSDFWLEWYVLRHVPWAEAQSQEQKQVATEEVFEWASVMCGDLRSDVSKTGTRVRRLETLTHEWGPFFVQLVEYLPWAWTAPSMTDVERWDANADAE